MPNHLPKFLGRALFEYVSGRDCRHVRLLLQALALPFIKTEGHQVQLKKSTDQRIACALHQSKPLRSGKPDSSVLFRSIHLVLYLQEKLRHPLNFVNEKR